MFVKESVFRLCVCVCVCVTVCVTVWVCDGTWLRMTRRCALKEEENEVKYAKTQIQEKCKSLRRRLKA